MAQNLIIDLTPETLIKNKDEFKRFISAIKSIETYESDNLSELSQKEKGYAEINSKYPFPKYPFNYKERISRLKSAINQNQKFFNELIKIYRPPQEYYKDFDLEEINHLRFNEQKFVINILIYIMRDWSEERAKERDDNYKDIINDVIELFPQEKKSKENYQILIPGCAVNRLGYELVKLGYDVEGNDYLILNGVISDYIFNKSKKYENYIYPFIYSFSNFWNEDDVFKKFCFPDVDIDLKNNDNYGKFKMTVGDFISLYENIKEYYDCVITCFFIDTAQNIIHYIDIIYNVLKKGGIWINFGPLSYHFSAFIDQVSIELPYDKLKEVIMNYGFKLIKESFKETPFGYMDNNMRNETFKCIYFVVKKS